MNAKRDRATSRRPNWPSRSPSCARSCSACASANATGELDEHRRLGRAKRDLARALTVARERELTTERDSERLTENERRDEETWPTRRRGRRRRAERRLGGRACRARTAPRPRLREAEAAAAPRRRGRGRDAAAAEPRPEALLPPEGAPSQARRSHARRRGPARRARPRSATPSATPSAAKKATPPPRPSRCRNARSAPSAAPPAPRRPRRLAPVHAPAEGAPKVRQGIVVSDKADKTITVRIDIARRHRRYKKIVRTLEHPPRPRREQRGPRGRPRARDREPAAVATKRWRLVEVLERRER